MLRVWPQEIHVQRTHQGNADMTPWWQRNKNWLPAEASGGVLGKGRLRQAFKGGSRYRRDLWHHEQGGRDTQGVFGEHLSLSLREG